MSVVDSSGWVEYLTAGPNADAFAAEIERADELIVPTIVLIEVRRWLLVHDRRADADEVTTLMSRGIVTPLDARIAKSAADLGIAHRLPLADSIIYATAQALDAMLWTQDRDFEGLPGVRYFPKLA